MAKDTTKDTKEATVASLITDVPQQDTTAQQPPDQQSSDNEAKSGKRNKTILLFAGVAFALAFLLYGAFVAGRQSVNKQTFTPYSMRSSSGDTELSPDQMSNSDDYAQGPRGGMMRGGWDQDQDTATDSSRVSGVVTAVSGDTITVAGGGTTTTVTTTSSTDYTGSSKPAQVNDTITVFGTKNSDDSITATSIRLYRS